MLTLMEIQKHQWQHPMLYLRRPVKGKKPLLAMPRSDTIFRCQLMHTTLHLDYLRLIILAMDNLLSMVTDSLQTTDMERVMDMQAMGMLYCPIPCPLRVKILLPRHCPCHLQTKIPPLHLSILVLVLVLVPALANIPNSTFLMISETWVITKTTIMQYAQQTEDKPTKKPKQPKPGAAKASVPVAKVLVPAVKKKDGNSKGKKREVSDQRG
ncbi:hypothetical protein BDP27DRAFT_1361275 [Rhodocollybia butyracea]|uniref:Uncharacterized protein n=1 Tax=Rhodocollybia butyracea TaxID=206335 RepID=A0A9P5PZR1_9AGAR|nr:hypothetical protein BDP27DRAFT_1361275 [Rhodocollybia butyracea]